MNKTEHFNVSLPLAPPKHCEKRCTGSRLQIPMWTRTNEKAGRKGGGLTNLETDGGREFGTEARGEDLTDTLEEKKAPKLKKWRRTEQTKFRM